MVGLGEDFLWLPLAERHVAFAADGQQQGVHPGGVHRLDFHDAGEFLRRQRCHQLVDEVAEAGVLLRRAAHHGEVPDGILAVIDIFHLHDWEIVGQAVIT